MPMLSRTTSSSRTTTLLLLFLLILSLLVSFCAAVCSFYASTANTGGLNWAGLFGPVVLVFRDLIVISIACCRCPCDGVDMDHGGGASSFCGKATPGACSTREENHC
ncbi:hypothetical protein OIU76_022258 [Salix suchowensis]|nr:hypothetical protein OIU76_022258 [Salix suchowensis]